MGIGANIGNTFDNTTKWETGWGNPPITREFIANLKKLGFKTVRVPVAWDTYAEKERISPDKMARVAEVVDWILDEGMYCVVNIHWDGGWIDSSWRSPRSKNHNTFTGDAKRKYVSYWTQIASHFADRNERLLFEALNEETNFEGEGSRVQAYATLGRVNQLFIDTVRKTGGNNAKRMLIITGYGTDIAKTVHHEYVLPVDSVPNRLMISVHYYTPWPFAGMEKDGQFGKMTNTWGSEADVRELHVNFSAMADFCEEHDMPAFVGEFGVAGKKETAARVRWMTAVAQAALNREMVPVLWDTGGDLPRNPPYGASPALIEVLENLGKR
jgi:endoglucanase